MTIKHISPPCEYLRTVSDTSLQSFELARLNRAANLRREIAALIDQWLEETSEALLARWMLEHHNALRPPALPTIDIFHSLLEPSSDPLPDSPPHSLDSVSPVPPMFAGALRPLDQLVRRKATK
jgi:hypothetical protein